MKEIIINASDGLPISAALFECDNPKALIQVIHGAKEHKERYYAFSEFLNKNGYAVIVSDLRGHGHSVNEEYFFGNCGVLDLMIDDQYTVTKYIKELYPDKSLYIFSHSFGSCIARTYIMTHDDEIEKLGMSGTIFPMMAGKAAEYFCGKNIDIFGGDTTKGIPPRLANAKSYSWICANPESMEKYMQDSLCVDCKYTEATVNTVVEAVRTIGESDRYLFQNPELKIRSFTGTGDPFTGGKYGLRKTIKILKAAGYRDVRCFIYKGMKHEVINEKGKKKVYKDILDFYND